MNLILVTIMNAVTLMCETYAIVSVPCVAVHSLKPYWNAEFERLRLTLSFGTIYGLVLVDLKQGHCNRYACPVRLNINWE